MEPSCALALGGTQIGRVRHGVEMGSHPTSTPVVPPRAGAGRYAAAPVRHPPRRHVRGLRENHTLNRCYARARETQAQAAQTHHPCARARLRLWNHPHVRVCASLYASHAPHGRRTYGERVSLSLCPWIFAARLCPLTASRLLLVSSISTRKPYLEIHAHLGLQRRE